MRDLERLDYKLSAGQALAALFDDAIKAHTERVLRFLNSL